VADLDGETLVVEGQPGESGDVDRLERAWNEARDKEYEELTAISAKFLAEIAHEFEIEKSTLAELEEEESELEKLRHWHQRIAARDVCEAAKAGEAAEAVKQAAEAFERYSNAVYEQTRP
jgi:hypothetical protein